MRRFFTVLLMVTVTCSSLFVLTTQSEANVSVELWTAWGQENVDLLNKALAPWLEKNPDIELNISPQGEGLVSAISYLR